MTLPSAPSLAIIAFVFNDPEGDQIEVQSSARENA